MRVILFLTSLYASFMSGIVSAKQTDAAEQLEQRLNINHSLQGEFVQTITGKNGDNTQIQRGTFIVQRPGFYRWESQDPFAQVVVGNGETVWIYDPDLDQVNITKQANLAQSPASILSGTGAELSRSYQVATKGEHTSVLTPLERASGPFESLTVTLEGSTPISVEFIDQMGQTTHLAFSKLVLNETVDVKHFDFEVPEGADVIVNE